MRRRQWFFLVPLLVLPQIAVAGAKVAPIAPTLQMVPMRDGTKLATDVYLPADQEPPFPVVLMRTPYGRKGNVLTAQRLCQAGYALVSQDIRGRGQSEGHHSIIFHNGGWSKRRDGHDTLLWIADQNWCDGNVGTMGGSALGITQNMLAPDAPDVLKGQIVSVAFSSMYHQGAYQGGVFRDSLMGGWLKATKMLDVNLKTFREHPNYDEFWDELNPEAQAQRVNAPGAFTGGWYDIFLQGTINSFVSIQNAGGPRARAQCRLVIGPYAHGRFNELKYPENSRNDRQSLWFRSFDHWLKGKDNGAENDYPVRYYVMGDPTDESAPGNYWRNANSWPPKAIDTRYYFHGESKLTKEAAPEGDSSLSYQYDPANPVATVGGQNLMLPKGPMDQRKVESREDVLLFSTDVLDEPVEVTGRIRAKLFVSSDCPDTDFTVKLCDVYPDGRSMLVTDGVLRARHRTSFERDDLLEPGEVYELDVDLWSTSLVFNRGHRIRIAVSSSNSPRFEPNPNTGQRWQADVDTETRIASNTLHLSEQYPSHILLPIFDDEPTQPVSE